MTTLSKTDDNQWMLWEVFIQAKSGQPHTHAGSLHAPDDEIALQNARDVYSRRGEAISIWVVPSKEIRATSPNDHSSFFDPAESKVYRHPQFYKSTRRERS